jgi:hypothetical protein
MMSKYLKKLYSMSDCNNLNEEITNFYNWCNLNRLGLNIEK